MTRVDSYGAPYVQYGSTKYKGMLVYSEPLSAEYIAQEKANWELSARLHWLIKTRV